MSTPACRSLIAQVCRNTWGVMCLVASDGHRCAAGRNVFGDQPLHGIAAEPSAAVGWEHTSWASTVSFGQPRLEHRGGLVCQRDASLLAILAAAEQMTAGAEV